MRPDWILKSKLYRSEIRDWSLLGSLMGWALLASVFALENRTERIIIAVDESGTRLVTGSDDRILRTEMKNFFLTFLNSYYAYTSDQFEARMGTATELMSDELWEQKREEILKLKKKLEGIDLEQRSEIERIELVDDGRAEALLKVSVISRLNSQSVNLKVRLGFRRVSRTERNPWGIEITEVSDETI